MIRDNEKNQDSFGKSIYNKKSISDDYDGGEVCTTEPYIIIFWS